MVPKILARVGVGLGALVTLWLDSLTPIGFAIWLFYYLVLLGASYFYGKAGLLVFCLLCALFVILGGFVSQPSGVSQVYVIVNRFSSVMILFILGYFLYRDRQLTVTLRERSEELSRLNRDLESFNYSVSHDLKNPLNVIRGFGHLLMASAADTLDAEQRTSLSRIVAESERMSAIVADLLRLASLSHQELKYTMVDVSELARESIAALKLQAASQEVDFVVQPQLSAWADRGLVRILLDNLIGNAIKFSARSASPRVEVGRRGQGNAAAFFVADNGAGFDMQKAQRLFDPFVRLHPSGEYAGTGIGLSIVRRIVERHGGRIWVQSKEGLGTTFFFTLGRRPPAASGR